MDQIIRGELPWSDGSSGGDYCDAPYRNLAAAVVLQAVNDYIRTFHTLWNPKLPRNVKRMKLIEQVELEQFFHSAWYEMLCDIDPEKVIHNCRVRAEEQERAAISRQNKKKMKTMLKDSAGKDGVSQ